MRRGSTAAAILAVLATLVSACGFNPADHALPGTGVRGDSYRIGIEFSSVLNLPPGAVISLDGAKVGTTTGLQLQPDKVVVAADIASSARIPADTRAELRQTTILGDVYIALSTPVSGGGADLRDGGTIPLAQTDPGPQVEEVLRRVATFVNGGGIQAVQNAVDKLNQALPADPAEIASLSTEVAHGLGDAAASVDRLDSILNSLQDMADRLVRQRQNIADVFSPQGTFRLEQTSKIGNKVFGVTVELQRLTNSMTYLLPRLPVLNAALDKVVPLVRQPSPRASEFNGNLGALIDLFRTRILPWAGTGTTVDVAKLTVGETDATVLLKMIGGLG